MKYIAIAIAILAIGLSTACCSTGRCSKGEKKECACNCKQGGSCTCADGCTCKG